MNRKLVWLFTCLMVCLLSSTSFAYNPISCTTDSDCTGLASPPVCDYKPQSTCGSDHTCQLRLQFPLPMQAFPNGRDAASCYCVQGDAKSCIVSGARGISTCDSTGNWSSCDTSGYTGQGDSWNVTYAEETCTGTIQCFATQASFDYHVCADIDNVTCAAPSVGGTEKCICTLAKLSDEPGCVCMKHDIRSCTKTGGGAGHQTCDASGSSTNDWGVATSWSSCT